jgi:hypothetical protein
MSHPTLNGVEKPADQIARGPHVYDEATHKDRETPQTFSEYPRAMWHQTKGYAEALSREQQAHMESEGWSKTPFPTAAAKETVLAQSNDLAMIVLQQSQMLSAMQEKLAKLEAGQPTTAPAIPLVAPKSKS